MKVPTHEWMCFFCYHWRAGVGMEDDNSIYLPVNIDRIIWNAQVDITKLENI
jgi:hypothetical protein